MNNGITEFVQAVAEMRRLQKAWFAGDRSHSMLIAAKQAEKRVDTLLNELAGDVEDIATGQERIPI